VAGATILKGVRLRRGAIVGGGSVVNKEVLAYTVVGGVPAKIVSIRFNSLDALIQHEEALYPPDKRLTTEEIQRTLRHGKKESE
jgi:serine acetyltransferase